MNLKHIFKIIWAERYQNTWLLLELIFIFCILWFCTDYLFFIGKRYIEPKGFNIENTYLVDIGIKEEAQPLFGDEENRESLNDDFWRLLDRIKNYPGVDDISLSLYCYPYTGSFNGSGFKVDSANGFARINIVSPGFFNVFKIDMDQGKVFDWGEKKIIISSNREGQFVDHPINEVKTVRDHANLDEIFEVCGIANKSKRSEFDDYIPIVYRLMDKNNLNIPELDVCIRVKPEADKNFIQNFAEEMETKLDVGPYYLNIITSIEDGRKNYMEWTGFDNDLKSIYSISVFLIINIFLGIIGAFWFRTQSRRSEIGLRIAIGSSKNEVKSMFIKEAVLLLFLASVAAAILCINITIIDVLKNVGIPETDPNDGLSDTTSYIVNYGFTFLFLAIIAIIAVWYPTRSAAKTQPAEALRDE